MALTKILPADLTGKGVVGLPDTPGLSTTEMQEKLDEIANDVIVPKHNSLVDDLEATTGASNLGALSSTGTASNIQTELDNRYPISTVTQLLDNKVDKEPGKSLSTNDFSAAYKYKLDNIEDNANNYVLPKGSQTSLGGVMGDGTTFTIDENGYGHAIGGGGGGTADYNALVNKPIYNGKIFSGDHDSEYYGVLRPYLVVTSEVGSTITISKGGETITATQKSGSTTQWEVCPTSYGTWTVSSDLPGADIATTTIVIDAVKTYAITVEHITATITVTYQAGATCVCKKGTTEYVATSNPQTFTVRSIGNWTIETVYDGITKSVSVPITADGQTESVTIEYATIEVTYGNAFRGTTITCTSGSTVYSKTAPSSGNTLSFTIASTGTWVVSGTVSGDTYSQTVAVSTMTTYPVTLNVFNATVTVTFPYSDGASCTITDGVTTLTANTSPMAFNVPNVGTWTATCTIDNVSAPTQSAVITTDGQTETMTFAFGTINLTYDNAFRGLTITCVNGGTTISKTAPISGNTMAFYPPSTGEWIISATYSGVPYQTSATITSLAVPVSAILQTIPDGSTVTPTDVIQTWLKCATINDKSYTTLNEVLADTDTFTVLLQDSNACDYMARSTTWASTICADADAMARVGKYDYCSDALLNNSTWCTAICNSTYFESVLNVKVPTMTSNTTPSGVASASTEYSGGQYNAYSAFDGNDSTLWSARSATNEYVEYEFPSAVLVKYVDMLIFKNSDGTHLTSYMIQASNDNFASDTNTLYTESTVSNERQRVPLANNTTKYKYYRIYGSISNPPAGVNIAISSLQFYGRHEAQTNIIHSAASDTLYYIDGTNQTIGTTDTSGVGSVTWSNVPVGNLTIYSSVANDPDDLTSAYSKTVRITPNTTEVYVMPDNALYWYGYIGNSEDMTNENGWSGSYTSPTHNTNNISVQASSGTNTCGVGTKNTISFNKAIAIVKGETVGSGTYGNIAATPSKTVGAEGEIAQSISSSAVAKVEVTNSNHTYCDVHCRNNRAFTLYALWYE